MVQQDEKSDMTVATLAPRKEKTTPKPKPKPRPKAKAKPKPKPKAKPVEHKSGIFAASGVAIMSMTSAGLNGYAFSQYATVQWAGWTLGLIIPVFVLILFKVSGDKFKCHRNFAVFTGATGTGVLLLSVWHCSESISLLTGSPILLAIPLAIACDIGLVCCEVALLLDVD